MSSVGEAGRLKALAVTSSKRSAVAPEVPTMVEAGLPGYEITSWQAMFAPARTPREIVLRLHAEVAKILKHPDVASRLADLGADPSGMTPEELSGIELDRPRLME